MLGDAIAALRGVKSGLGHTARGKGGPDFVLICVRRPTGITACANGTFLVADSFGNRVRRVVSPSVADDVQRRATTLRKPFLAATRELLAHAAADSVPLRLAAEDARAAVLSLGRARRLGCISVFAQGVRALVERTQTAAARPAPFASRSVRRALLTPRVNPGSLCRCGRRTQEQAAGHGRRERGPEVR